MKALRSSMKALRSSRPVGRRMKTLRSPGKDVGVAGRPGDGGLRNQYKGAID